MTITAKFCTRCGTPLNGATSCNHAGTDFADQQPFDATTVTVNGEVQQPWQFSAEERAVSEQALSGLARVTRDTTNAYRRRLFAVRAAYSKAVKEYDKGVAAARKAAAQEKQEKRIAGGQFLAPVQVFEQSVVIDKKRYALSETTKAVVDTAGNLMTTQRLTLTRFALLGPFSLFAPKKRKDDKRELYLLAEDTDWAAVAKFKPDSGRAAREIAQTIELTARRQQTIRSEREQRSLRADEVFARIRDDRSGVDAAQVTLDGVRGDAVALRGACTQLSETLARVGGDSRQVRKARSILAEAEHLLEVADSPVLPPADISDDRVMVSGGEPDPEAALNAARQGVLDVLSAREQQLGDDAAPGELGHTDVAASPPIGADHHPDTLLATIERLAALNQAGIITDEEFAAKKTQLLDRL